MPSELVGLELSEQTKSGPRSEWTARQAAIGRAVRVVSLGQGVANTSPVARTLLREAQALGALEHDGIVQLYELRTEATGPVLVAEEVIAPSLLELLPPAFHVGAAVDLASQLAEALAHAHERGVIHGRLGLSSVRFSRSGRLKLEGFGQMGPEDEPEPIEPPTADGLSPETAVGQRPSRLTDVFCWGAVVYQVLTGHSPFGSPKDPGYPSRVRGERPLPIGRSSKECPAALRALVERCLDKQPAARPASLGEVLGELRALAAGESSSLLAAELGRRGSISWEEPMPAAAVVAPRPVLGRGLTLGLGGVVLGAALSTTGFLFLRDDEPNTPTPRSLDSIEQKDTALLRVLVTPWAHVIVDGVHRETTPFAAPLRLAPGRHVVRLEHPEAPPEERTVDAEAGQTLLLDVQMQIQRRLLPEAAPATETDTTP